MPADEGTTDGFLRALISRLKLPSHAELVSSPSQFKLAAFAYTDTTAVNTHSLSKYRDSLLQVDQLLQEQQSNSYVSVNCCLWCTTKQLEFSVCLPSSGR